MNVAQEIVIQLLIDDGVLSRGHRKNILSNEFNFVGVSFGQHSKHKCICVMDFASEIHQKLEE